VAVAVVVIGTLLFATVLHGLARTDTRLAATTTRSAPDSTNYPCPHLDARDEV